MFLKFCKIKITGFFSFNKNMLILNNFGKKRYTKIKKYTFDLFFLMCYKGNIF